MSKEQKETTTEGQEPEAPKAFGSALQQLAEKSGVPVNDNTGAEMKTSYEHVDFTGVDFDSMEAEEHLPTDHPEFVFTKVERGSPQYGNLFTRGYREYRDEHLSALVGDQFQIMVIPRKVYEKRYRDYLSTKDTRITANEKVKTDLGDSEHEVRRSGASSLAEFATRAVAPAPQFSSPGVEA